MRSLSISDSESAIASSAVGPGPTKLKVLIVDDHPVTRQGLRTLVNAQLNLQVCGEADCAAEAMELAGRLDPQLAILDVSLKETNGIELTRTLRARSPGLPILVVSMHEEVLLAERALRAGAMGYVMKQEAGEKVATAIEHLLRGDIYLSGRVREKILRRFVKHRQGDLVFAMETLSDRELEVLQGIGEGYGTREIAQRLGLSTKTIDSYREHLKFKLGIASGADLVRHAVQWVRMEAKL